MRCVIYEWIRLDELFSLMGSFFSSNFEIIFELQDINITNINDDNMNIKIIKIQNKIK